MNFSYIEHVLPSSSSLKKNRYSSIWMGGEIEVGQVS
jgi:hypothetical protein